MKYYSNSNDVENFFGEFPLLASSIRVTKKCNAKCKHCYGSSGEAFPNELTTTEIKNLIDQLKDDMNVDKMFFTGGEPFTRDDIVELIHYADYKQMKIMISTNAGLVTEEILKEIKDCNFNMFQISLDGNRQTHDNIRGEGIYDSVIRALELVNKYSFKNVTLATCLTKENFNEIDQILDIVMQYKVPIYALVLLLVAGRASKDLDVTSDELLLALDKLFEIYRKYGNLFKIAENSIIPPALVPEDLRATNLHKSFQLCCAFPNIMGVEANGNVAPCDGFFGFPEYIAGNIREHSLRDLWDNADVFRKLRELDVTKLRGVCAKCKFLKDCVGSCRASAYAYYGKIDAPFPTCQKLYDDGKFPKDSLNEKRKD